MLRNPALVSISAGFSIFDLPLKSLRQCVRTIHCVITDEKDLFFSLFDLCHILKHTPNTLQLVIIM